MAFEPDNILFPTDFSKNAQKALPLAAKIASLTGSKLILYHTIHGTLDRPDFSQDRDHAINEANKQFEHLIADLKKEEQYKDLVISTILQSGPPTTGLLEEAVESNSGLIVMGTKGATGNRNVLFGSVASSTITKTDVPVLAVPPGTTTDDLKHIVFTTDYHEGDLQALEQTIGIAELFNSSIDVIHVAEEKSLVTEMRFRGFRELVKENTGYENISFDIKYDYDFFPAMTEYFIDNPHSLLVMVRYKKTFWEKLVQKNHSKEMAFYTNVPVLVLIGD